MTQPETPQFCSRCQEYLATIAKPICVVCLDKIRKEQK